MSETGTQRYKNALRAAQVLMDLDNLDGAGVCLDEARVVFKTLEADAMKNTRIQPDNVIKSGIGDIPDRYVFRGVMMTVIDAASTYVTYDEIREELNLINNMMWNDRADEVVYDE